MIWEWTVPLTTETKHLYFINSHLCTFCIVALLIQSIRWALKSPVILLVMDKCTVLPLLHCVVQHDIMQSLILYVRSIYIWSMVMSRCLIISQAYKRAIGLPVAAVILIDGGQVGATVLPSDRLCLFIQSAVCPPYPPQGYIHWIYSRQEGRNMLMMPRSPEEKQKHFQSKLSTLVSGISHWISRTFATNTAHTVSRLSTAPIHYVLLCPPGAYINWIQ